MGLVQLFNLKLGKDGTMCITERSGVRGGPLQLSPPALPPCSPSRCFRHYVGQVAMNCLRAC